MKFRKRPRNQEISKSVKSEFAIEHSSLGSNCYIYKLKTKNESAAESNIVHHPKQSRTQKFLTGWDFCLLYIVEK